MLVDDDPTTNFINEHLLRKLGVTKQVLVAHNGEEALNTLAETCTSNYSPTCPKLILLDINMPIMNGIEFLEAYNPQPPAQAIVVIALTTTTNLLDVNRLRELAIADIIIKPLTKEKVHTIMSQHFA
jgi:CheY-like chemotaxis protein